MAVLSDALLILAPIIMGAVIGYVTNAIAIRMLFRPYKAWYVGPLRVPLTPGIIPRQRERLAVSLGRMVSKELFQEEGIVEHLRSPQLKSALLDSISGISSSFFAMEAPTAHDSSGSEGRGISSRGNNPNLVQLQADLENLTLRMVESFVCSPRFHHTVLGFTHALASPFLDARPGSSRRVRGFWIFLRRELAHMDLSEAAQARVESLWNALVDSWEARNLAVRDLAGDAWVPLVVDAVDSLYPSLEKLLVEISSRPEIRHDLHERGYAVLSRTMDRLNTVQRSLLKMGGYEGKLRDNLPAIIDDALGEVMQFLHQDQTRRTLGETLAKALGAAALSPVSGLTSSYGIDLRRLGRDSIAMVYQALRAGELPEKLFKGSGPSLYRMLDGSQELTWGEILERRLGMPCSEVLDSAAGFVVRRLRTEHGLGTMKKLVTNLITGLNRTKSGTPGKPAEGGLSREEKSELDELAAAVLQRALESVLPRALEAFNLQKFVEARVAQLNVQELEGLIVGLVGKEFAWINIFGAILGGLVGIIQILAQNLLRG